MVVSMTKRKKTENNINFVGKWKYDTRSCVLGFKYMVECIFICYVYYMVITRLDIINFIILVSYNTALFIVGIYKYIQT